MLEELLAALPAPGNRLLTLDTPLPGNPLLVERFRGHEALSEPFRFEIDCLSGAAQLDLAALLGAGVGLGLLCADGRRRPWHGHVTEALRLGADGGLARYRLVVEPWLAFLGLRRNSRIFQGQTALEVLGTLFAAYPVADWASQLTAPLRRHSRLTQYRETDLAFVQRLLAGEGLSYRFEHHPAGPGGEPARHQLILFDPGAELPDGPQPTIRFHRSDATEADDTLQIWQEALAVQATAVSLSGWDYKTLAATGAEASRPAPGALPRLEIHHGTRPYPFDSAETAQRQADLTLAHHEAAARRFSGEGSVRSLAAGTRFTLSQHATHRGEAARFSVLAVSHHGANNLGAQAARLLASSDIEAGSYRNRCTAQPAAAPIVPAPRARPTARPQTARVVGLPGSVMDTDRDHRVRIQFPWQRGDAPNPGGLAAPEGEPSNAPGDARSGTWVRVAEWLAGPDWGSHFLPRIGTEVLVDFIDGDIDRPVVVGQVYQGSDLPPFPAGKGAAANHPGVLSGWMSHNFAEGHNQWLVDDAPGQLRTRLASSQQASQLGLGHLIHQPLPGATRGPWRGSGFELRTDGWLALRAGEGLLLSTTPRPDGQGTQLEAAEGLARLKAAAETARALSDAAAAQGALPLAANTAQTAFIQAIDPRQQGRFAGEVGGQPTVKASTATPGEAAERFAAPFIVAESPTDIGHATPASGLAFAGSQLHATGHHDLHLAGALSLSAVAGEAASLFSHSGGIRSIAAAGPHSIAAHADALEILADQSVTLTSSADEIHILAHGKIVLQAGQAAVTLEGGDITFACPGTFSVKGNGHAFLGPGKGTAEMPTLPTSPAAPSITTSDMPSLAPETPR